MMSLRILLIWVLFLALLIPTQLSAQSNLTFSMIEGSPPGGQAEAILRAAYGRLGIKVAFEYLPAKRSLLNSGTGVTDGEAFRMKGVDKEYPDLIRIDVPILIDPIHFYVTPGKEFPVDGWQSIPKDYILGYRRGVKFIENAIAKYSIKSIANNNEFYSLRQLDAGYVTVIVGHPERFAKLASRIPTVQIVRLDPPVQIVPLYHYLHKKHLAFVPEITRVLSEMMAPSKEPKSFK